MTLAVKTRFIEAASNKITELPQHDLVETKVYSNPFINENDSQFSESRIRIRYELRNTLRDHFVLFRGLVEFSRPHDITFVFDRTENSFVANVTRNRVSALKKLLLQVQIQLAEELKFKKNLKAAMHFERQYRLQCEEVYRGHALAS